MLNDISPFALVTIISLFILGVLLVSSSVRHIRGAFTATNQSRFERAKKLIVRRRALFDKKQGTVFANQHDPWLEEAKSFQKDPY